jgi:ABC-2 type transport system ATP-binding protein
MTFRFLWQKVAVFNVVALVENSPFDDRSSTAVAILLIWFSYAAVFAVVFNEFYDFKALKHTVYYFSVPVLILDVALFGIYGVGTLGAEGFTLSSFLLWLMVAELVLGLVLPLSRVVEEKRYPVIGRSEIVGSILAILGAILCFTPLYFAQSFFGFVSGTIDIIDISEEHRFVIYLAFVIPFIIFHLLKDKSKEAKHFALTFLAIGGLWSFLSTGTILDWIQPFNWPLHLCNFAMFVIAAALLFKWDKVFYFTMFMNVIGALMAMLMPNYGDGVNAMSTQMMNYWFNHYMAFFMPILIIALGVFPRPKFKEWVWAEIGFLGYFLLALFSNAWLSAVYDRTVDYFFLNSNFIAEKLGPWAEKLLDITATLTVGEHTLVFYPLYQALFYLGYSVATVAMWFVYEVLYKLWDAAIDRREKERAYKDMRKKLRDYLGGRPATEPISGDGSPSIVLKDFRKKYGSNKHYSVDGVSFEVKAGEIFGFLGPNGAGKSTIIKSMVGIQTITSGAIEICGYDVEMQSVMAKSNIGFVPDHYALYENLTGREYVNYIADLYGVDRAYRDEIIEKCVERFQLTGSFDNPMKTYSHGMKQKITIMSALVHNPKVWILDEPLTGLDPTSIHEVKECMKEHAAAGNIVFFSSHIIDVVEKLCDRIAIIKKGKLQAVRTIPELAEAGIDLEQFYLDIIYAEENGESSKSLAEETAAPAIGGDEEVAPA